MNEGKSSISKAGSYEEMGDYWDTHDTSNYWNEVPSSEFDIDAKSQAIYYPIDIALAQEMRAIAKRMGVPTKDLLAQWVRERLSEATQEGSAEVSSSSSV